MEFQTTELGENMIIKTEPDNDEEFTVNLECTEHVTVKPELSEDTENLTVKSEYANCVMENMLKPECCENVIVKTEYKEEVDDESSSFNCLCFGEQPNLEKNCSMFLKNNGKQELEGVVSILGTDLALNNPDKTNDTGTASLIKKTFAENIKMEPGELILECEEEISMLTESCSSNDEDENRNECQLADSVLLDKFNSDMYLYKIEEMQERKHLETDCILKEPVYDISSHVTGCQVTRKHLTRYAARNKKEKNKLEKVKVSRMYSTSNSSLKMSVRDVIGPHGKLSLVFELDHTRSLSRDNKEVNLQSGKKIIQTSKQPNQESSGQSFITYKHKCANSEKNHIKKEEINWPEGVVDLMEEHISSSEFAEGVVDLMEEYKGVDALMEEHNYFSTNKHTTKRFLLMKSEDKNSEHEFQKSVISRPMKRQTFIEGEHYIMSKNMRFVCMLCNQHFRKMLSFEHHARDTHYMYSCTVYHAVFTEKNQLLNHSRHCVYVSLSDHDSGNSASKRVSNNASKRVTDHDLEDLAKSSPKKRKSLRPNRYPGKKDGQQYEQLSVNKGLDYYIKKREFVKCSQCESLFVSKGHLEAHIKSEHRKFICSMCGASFKKRSVYQKHNRSCVLPWIMLNTKILEK